VSTADQLLQQHLARVTAPLAASVYVVLDLAGSAATEIIELRRSVGYDYLGALPVEITVTGSGGVGAPRNREDPRRLFETLDKIVSRTQIITGRLGNPLRFPGSDVIVLPPADPEPLQLLHHEIANSGIDFEPSPFEYIPHCTLSQKPDPSPDEVDRLIAAQIAGDFVAATLSAYDMHVFPMCNLRWRGYLR
jgi:hypothetical protein